MALFVAFAAVAEPENEAISSKNINSQRAVSQIEVHVTDIRQRSKKQMEQAFLKDSHSFTNDNLKKRKGHALSCPLPADFITHSNSLVSLIITSTWHSNLDLSTCGTPHLLNHAIRA